MQAPPDIATPTNRPLLTDATVQMYTFYHSHESITQALLGIKLASARLPVIFNQSCIFLLIGLSNALLSGSDEAVGLNLGIASEARLRRSCRNFPSDGSETAAESNPSETATYPSIVKCELQTTLLHTVFPTMSQTQVTHTESLDGSDGPKDAEKKVKNRRPASTDFPFPICLVTVSLPGKLTTLSRQTLHSGNSA